MNTAFFYDNREFLVSCAVAVICATLFLFFPTTGLFDTLIASGIFLVGIPLLYGKVILKKAVTTWHLTRGTWNREALIATVASFCGTIIFTLLLLQSESFVTNYSGDLPESIFISFSSFLLYEIVGIGILLLFLEFFFRGFLLTLLRERYGFFAITIQTIIVCIFFSIDHVPLWSLLLLGVFSFCAGTIAYYTRSVYYSFIYIFFAALFFDTMIINTLT